MSEQEKRYDRWVELKGINPAKRIEAIKGIRAVADIDLRTAKNIIDDLQEHITRRIKLREDVTLGLALNTLHAHDIRTGGGEKFEQQEGKAPKPFSIDNLALYLALILDLQPQEVENLADGLEGIEDASGSLERGREAHAASTELGGITWNQQHGKQQQRAESNSSSMRKFLSGAS